MPPGSAEVNGASDQLQPLVKHREATSTSSKESMKTTDDETLKAPTRTCCFCVNVRPAAALFMIVEVAFFAALLFTGLINISNSSAEAVTVPYLGLLLCYLISLVAAVLVLYGIFTNKALLLIPYLVKQVFTITLTLIFIYKAITVYFGHYGISVSTVFRQLHDSESVVPGVDKLEQLRSETRPLHFSLNSPTAAKHIGALLLLGGCFAICIEILATDTVRKCYHYFRDRSRLASANHRKA